MKKVGLMGIFMLMYCNCIAQKINWQNLDLATDSVLGMSTEKAYQQLLKGKKPKKVIVAIMDSGIDTTHEDLKSILWRNKDNSHGWNYIGQETGVEDITRLVRYKKQFYDSLAYTTVSKLDSKGYKEHRILEQVFESKINNMETFIAKLEQSKKIVDDIEKEIGKNNPTLEDFRKLKSQSDKENAILKLITEHLPFYENWTQCRYNEIDSLIALAKFHLKHGLNLNNMEIDTAIGNSDVSPDAAELFENPSDVTAHGTHVAGIIAAVRNNGIGINGVADNVQIMMIKLNGNIRELRDESLAKGIYFAVNHGAKVINISMGKSYSWNKRIVDEAVKYAMLKDVLIVHGAGNDGQNTDEKPFYPIAQYTQNTQRAKAWIQVGASRPYNDTVLVAGFSNYGKSSVDVFAPGTSVYSTIPGSRYTSWSGTSMAAPMVAGVAALIREYYPRLTAPQVTDIILKSVYKINHAVYVRDNSMQLKKIPFSETCSSGGVVNVYNALKLAATYK